MMTLDEKCAIIDKADELRKQGKIEEADELDFLLPLSPHIAKAIKEVYGLKHLLDGRYNLSEVEEVYGKDWFNTKS